MRKVYLLQDPETGYLWYDTLGRDDEYFVQFGNDYLDLAKCQIVVAEEVSVNFFGVAIASPELCVYRNEKGLMTVMFPYQDTMGEGALYASIVPGFEFISVYGFKKGWDLYIVTADENGKWSVFRASYMGNTWSFVEHWSPGRVSCDCDSMEEALAKSPVTFSCSEIMEGSVWSNKIIRDLTQPEECRHDDKNDEEVIDGITTAQILQCRSIRAAFYLPSNALEFFTQCDDVLEYSNDEILSHNTTDSELQYLRIRIRVKWLYSDESKKHMAVLFDLKEPFIINDDDLFAAYLLFKYKEYLKVNKKEALVDNKVDEQYQKKYRYFEHILSQTYSGSKLESAIERAIKNEDRIYELLRSTNEPGIVDLISAIHRSTFAKSNCHSHHHYPTGTLEHSLGVYEEMCKKAEELGVNVNANDLILVGLLHDVGDAGGVDEWMQFRGHGRRSRAITNLYLNNVSEDVLEAIEKHRHDPRKENIHNKPLRLLVFLADHADAAKCSGGQTPF